MDGPHGADARTAQLGTLAADCVDQVEGFDEVPLNLYLEKYPSSTAFIRGLYGVHTIYSNVCEKPDEMNPHSSENGNREEADFVEKLSQLI